MGLFSKLFGKGDPEPARDPEAEQAAKQARIDALAAQKEKAALERAAKPAPPPKEFVKRRYPLPPSRAHIGSTIPSDQLPTWEKLGVAMPAWGIDVVFENPLTIQLAELQEDLQFLFVDTFLSMTLAPDELGISGKIQFSFGELLVSTSREAYGDELMKSMDHQVPWEAIAASRQRGPKGEPSGYEVVARKTIAENRAVQARLLTHPYRCKLTFSGALEDELQVFDMIYVVGKTIGEKSNQEFGAVNRHARSFVHQSTMAALVSNRTGYSERGIPSASFVAWTGGIFEFKLPNGRFWYCTQGLHQFRIKELAYCDQALFVHIAYDLVSEAFWSVFLARKQLRNGIDFAYRGGQFYLEQLQPPLPLPNKAFGAQQFRLIRY